MLQLIDRMLRQEGYDVCSAESLQAASFELSSKRDFAVAIVDFWLANSTASDLIDTLVASEKQIPTVVVSGGAIGVSPELTKAMAETSGRVVFLQKPFRKQDLFLAIDKSVFR